MRFRYKTTDEYVRVSVHCGLHESISEAELGAFCRCRLPGFMKTGQLGRKRAVFLGPGAVPFTDVLKNPLSAYDFFMLIEQFTVSMRNLLQNGLSYSFVQFDPKKCFYAVNTKQLLLLYIPTEGSSDAAHPADFIESVSQMAIPENNADHIIRFAAYIRGLQGFDADAIERYIMREAPDVMRLFRGEAEIKGSGDATVLGEDADMTVLGEPPAADPDDPTVYAPPDRSSRPFLVRNATNERIYLSGTVLRIGARAELSDYTVCDNPAVSRKHADFFCESGCWYVRDLSSKNGTHINGRKAFPQMKTEISDGDLIRLANEEFVFHTS